jgi:hypothetical protein
MSITILDKSYSLYETILKLNNKNISSLPLDTECASIHL